MLLSRYIFDKQRFDTLYITEHFRCQLPGNAVDIFQEYVQNKKPGKIACIVRVAP